MGTLCIVMTKTQADAVRGDSAVADYAALEPSPLKDGVTFILPADFASNPTFADKAYLLSTYPQRVVDDSERINPPAFR